jgi:photosystem II stability/assembly factor-like uncharacterized protein
VSFLNAKLGYIVARIKPGSKIITYFRGVVFRTEDGCRTWKVITTTRNPGLKGGAFLNDSEAWLVPADLREEHILQTQNGGKTWVRLSTQISKILSIHFADSNNGWLIANRSDHPIVDEIFYTTDGGKTWTETNLPDR